MDRRRFLHLSIAAGASASSCKVFATPLPPADDPGLSDAPNYQIAERIAAGTATFFRPYCSNPMASPEARTWIQIDLGTSFAVDAVRLYPAAGVEGESWPYPYNFGTFPLRFKIEISDRSDFSSCDLIADCTRFDFADPKNRITQCLVNGKKGRYVRLTVTRMRPVPKSTQYAFAVMKIVVLSEGKDIAEQCIVTGNPVSVNTEDLQQITRLPRPQGEGIVTDHPENVSAAGDWKPVKYLANAPITGVTLNGGIFQRVMENNIQYLLESFSVDELLRQFRERAGKPIPPDSRTPNKFWDEDLAGSSAGRFLMGAGNTLRWIDHTELRSRLNAVVDGIDECKQANGYIMAYPEDTIFFSERGAYTRAWLTHGLLEAGYCGNPKAFELLRGYYDWFNQCAYLPKLLRGAGFGPQGMVANTRMYFTPVGKSGDIQVIQRYFQENYWLDGLAQHNKEAIWQYPYDRPHCYEVTFFEAYLDLYRATGDPKYLDAMTGAWDLYHDHWEHVGGSTSLQEFKKDPPGSYRLDQRHGEFCGSTFWVFFNQRFQLLNPEQEKYAAEIEKSIYNVGIANQAGSEGIRSFALLAGHKDKPTRINTCCEGQGTRLLGSLAEHIYSVASDGFYVNLFEPSSFSWKRSGELLQLKMTTEFPADPKVRLQMTVSTPMKARIRVRVPSWTSGNVDLMLNSKLAATGSPGTYVILDRTWSTGDEVSFSLPAALTLTLYNGADQIAGHRRYALEYGPILLAAAGSADAMLKVEGKHPEDLLRQLSPKPDQPLHFGVANHPEIEYMPYWQVKEQPFTCFPVIDVRA
jgi:uncharacterized protein